MSDIVERLRDADRRGVAPPQNWTTAAADEIAALREEVARLKAARIQFSGADAAQIAALRESIGEALRLLGTDPKAARAVLLDAVRGTP